MFLAVTLRKTHSPNWIAFYYYIKITFLVNVQKYESQNWIKYFSHSLVKNQTEVHKQRYYRLQIKQKKHFCLNHLIVQCLGFKQCETANTDFISKCS